MLNHPGNFSLMVTEEVTWISDETFIRLMSTFRELSPPPNVCVFLTTWKDYNSPLVHRRHGIHGIFQYGGNVEKSICSLSPLEGIGFQVTYRLCPYFRYVF